MVRSEKKEKEGFVSGSFEKRWPSGDWVSFCMDGLQPTL